MPLVVPRKKVLLKDLLKSRRIELNLSQRDVARGLGMSAVDFIGMVESGVRRLDLGRLKAVAQVLQLDLDVITEMTFREVYNQPETQWLIEHLYGHDRLLAGKIASLSRESQKLLRQDVDYLAGLEDKLSERQTA